MMTHVLRAIAGTCLAAAIAIAADVPRPAPDFTIAVVQGQPIEIKQYRGKVVVLAFILTTCPHCQQTVGYLSTLQNDLGSRGLQVLGCATDDMAAMLLPDFLTRFHRPFPVGYSNRDAIVAFLQYPSMFKMFMPQLVFIDRKGLIRAQYKGEDKFFSENQEKNLRDQIETLLKESAPAAKKRAAPAAKKTS